MTNNVTPSIPPQFSTAEIGTVNASTVIVTFDSNVSASNYATGVTIKVNGSATSITSATRQANHAIVRYVIPVLWHGSGDTVTWEYASGSGNIVSESDSTPLGDVTAQSVTNNCEYEALLDLQADTLALADNDPVSTWADQSGQNHDFTQTGTARPTKQTVSGYPVVSFDGINNLMVGSNFADGLDSFTVFVLCNLNSSTNSEFLISKSDPPVGTWFLEASIFELATDTSLDYINVAFGAPFYYDAPHIFTGERITGTTIHCYLDGDNTGESSYSIGTFTTMTNSASVVLASQLSPPTAGLVQANYYAVLICSDAPNATNRAALEARLAARYGITL